MTRQPFRVEIMPAAQRQLRALPPSVGARLRGTIVNLASVPRPSGAQKIPDTAYWRIRVGDLRVIFVIDEAARVVSITKAARRSESTYRRL